LDLFLKTIWDKTSKERLDGLILIMPERLKALINADSGETPYKQKWVFMFFRAL
jgi:hypothetical protein